MAKVKKKSKSGSVVYATFLILYIVLLCAIVYFALSKVWAYAQEHENAKPDPVIESYMERLNENLFDDTVAATIQSMPHPFQTDEEVAAVIQEMFGSELLLSGMSPRPRMCSLAISPGRSAARSSIFRISIPLWTLPCRRAIRWP